MNALHRSALQCLLYVWQLFTFHLCKGEGSGEGGWGRVPVRSRMRMDFSLSGLPFFGAYYGNASASNALSPWRGLPSHSSTFLLLLCPCSPFFFNDILKRAALSWASLWPSDSFEVGPKKEKAKKCALTFSVCGCHWPSTVYGMGGGGKNILEF